MSYEYDLEWNGQTSKAITYKTIEEAGHTPDSMKALLEDSIRSNLPPELKTQFNEKGYAVTTVEILEVYVWYRLSIPDPRADGQPSYYLYAKANVKLYTDTPFETSPLDPVTWGIIIIVFIVAATVVMLNALPLIKEAVESLYTTKTRIIKYDAEGNVVYDETKYEPDPFGLGMFWIFFLIILALMLFWFVGMPKGGKK